MTSYTVSSGLGSVDAGNFVSIENQSMTSGNTTQSITTPDNREFGPLEDFPEFMAALFVNRNCLRIIAAIGFPGNILSFITILRMKPYSHPSLYVAVLAISDNCCIASKLLFAELTRFDVEIGPAGCKLLYFLGNSTAMYANWLLILMTVERFLAIWFPLRVGAFCTRRRSGVAMGLLLVLVACLNLTWLQMATDSWVDKPGTDLRDYLCLVAAEYKDFLEYVWHKVDGVFYALIPCILLIVFNALIILGIKRAASIQRQLTEDVNCRNKYMSGPAAEKVRQQRQITIMLVVVCLTFVVLIMPNCVFFIYKPYWTDQTPSQVAKRRLAEQLCYTLSDLSHAINFFVYFISTKKFRERFLATVCCCSRWRHRITRSSHVCQSSHFSETGSVYVTSTSNGGFIPLSLRNSGRY